MNEWFNEQDIIVKGVIVTIGLIGGLMFTYNWLKEEDIREYPSVNFNETGTSLTQSDYADIRKFTGEFPHLFGEIVPINIIDIETLIRYFNEGCLPELSVLFIVCSKSLAAVLSTVDKDSTKTVRSFQLLTGVERGNPWKFNDLVNTEPSQPIYVAGARGIVSRLYTSMKKTHQRRLHYRWETESLFTRLQGR